MSERSAGLEDRRMVLRYAGRCRVCEMQLPAGTDAIYERSRRTVRCVQCEPSTRVVDAAAFDDSTTTSAPPSDALRLRAPASSVITELLRIQADVPTRSATARLFGRSPLSDESLSWYLGSLGELEVARVLDRLGDGWLVVHAIPVGSAGSDIDHLVVGPGGVFTINAKFHEGASVWVGSRRLLVNGQKTDHLRNAAFEARRVAGILTSAAGAPVGVTPIVAVVAEGRITVKERPADVVVLSSGRLARWLQNRSAVLTSDEVARLQRLVAIPETWGDHSLEPADLAGFAALRETVAKARRRRRIWAFGVLAAPLA
ncbi:MAG: nuclease-related domain-containing protein, partial [Mycetocola sp.]